MEKWDKYMAPPTEEELQEVISELECNQCPEESGSPKCHLHILAWTMDKIHGFISTTRTRDIK